jgi:hypothetical protein
MNTESAPATSTMPPVENVQDMWAELTGRVGQLEARNHAQEQELKSLRQLLERVIEHRQKSHSELVLLLTGLVSKLPLNDVGVVVSKLVEHHTNVSQYLAALVKGTAEAALPPPTVLKSYDQVKRDLLAAAKPVVDELIQLEAPTEPELLRSFIADPEQFFSARAVRANRCFMKGQVPRERVLREFGNEALVLFTDMTTDPKLNPRPKPEEIALGFRTDFEAILQLNPNLLGDKRAAMTALHQRVQRSRGNHEQGRAQRVAFQKLSFFLELLHYYQHQSTEPADVIFAQRLPALLEQLVLPSGEENLDEKLIAQAEGLLAFVINPDHRQMVINNIGKGDDTGKILKHVLKLRADKVPGLDQVIVEFIRWLIPSQTAPAAPKLASILRLIHPDMQRLVIGAMMHTDRLRHDEAQKLGRTLAEALDIKGLEKQLEQQQAVPPDVERRLAWNKIKDLISRRSDAVTIAAAIRERLHAKYDAEEIRQSWIVLTESDPISLIRIFSALPYRADGSTDAIARTVMDTYVTRLMHEKYVSTYHKVLNSLRNLFHAKADSPTLLNFMALVRWINPEAATKLCTDVGMPVSA